MEEETNKYRYDYAWKVKREFPQQNFMCGIEKTAGIEQLIRLQNSDNSSTFNL